MLFLTLGSVKTTPRTTTCGQAAWILLQLRNGRPAPESSGGGDGSGGLVCSASLHQVGQECLGDQDVWGEKFLVPKVRAGKLLPGALPPQQCELVNCISLHHDGLILRLLPSSGCSESQRAKNEHGC